jgi:hypothetical protein
VEVSEVSEPAAIGPQPGRRNVRAYFAGGAATTALVAGAVVLFGSLAAYVAFEGLPIAGDDAEAGTVVVGDRAGAPERAAAEVRAAPGAVARRPASSTVVRPAPTLTSLGGAVARGAGAAPGAEPTVAGPARVSAADPTSAAGSPTSVPTASADGSAPAPTAPAPETESSGTVGGVVDDVESTTDQAVDVPLGEATQGVTDTVDEAVGGTVDQVDGAVGGATDAVDGATDAVGGATMRSTTPWTRSMARLGGATDAVGGATDAVSGDGGLTDQVLGGG